MPLFDFFKQSAPQPEQKHSAWELPLAELLQPFLTPIMSFTPYKVEAAVTGKYREIELVYRCVQLISEQLSTLDYVVYDKEGQEVDNHPTEQLMANPNEEMPPGDFWELIHKHMELAGEAYMHYDNDRNALLPLFPDKVEVIPSTEAGKLIKGYRYNTGKVFLPEEVIHHKFIDPADGLHGIPPLQACYRHTDIVKAMDAWNYNSFSNRLVPDLAVMLDNDNIDQATLKEISASIRRQMSGSDNARKPLVLPAGRKIEKMSNTAVDMDFIDGRKASIEAISVAFGVPLPMLGIYDNGTFSNVESAAKDFWENTLLPKANAMCNSMTWYFTKQGQLKDGQYLSFRKKAIKALQRNYSDRVKDANIMGQLLINNGFDPQETMKQINDKFELGLDMDAIPWVEPIEDIPELVPGGNDEL